MFHFSCPKFAFAKKTDGDQVTSLSMGDKIIPIQCQ